MRWQSVAAAPVEDCRSQEVRTNEIISNWKRRQRTLHRRGGQWRDGEWTLLEVPPQNSPLLPWKASAGTSFPRNLFSILHRGRVHLISRAANHGPPSQCLFARALSFNGTSRRVCHLLVLLVLIGAREQIYPLHVTRLANGHLQWPYSLACCSGYCCWAND